MRPLANPPSGQALPQDAIIGAQHQHELKEAFRKEVAAVVVHNISALHHVDVVFIVELVNHLIVMVRSLIPHAIQVSNLVLIQNAGLSSVIVLFH